MSMNWPEDAPIKSMGLSARTTNALLANGIITCGQAYKASDDRLLRLEHFGRKSLYELRQSLASGPGYDLNLNLKDLQFEVQRLKGENDALWRVIEMLRPVLIEHSKCNGSSEQ